MSFRLDNFNSAKKKLDIYLSSSFNVFGYIKPNENLISDIIADMLNPFGNHGQKDLFLQKFFDIIIPDEINNNASYTVQREVATNYITHHNRRIDIIISDNENFGIGIENKPWAGEQPNQIKDYVEHLTKKYHKFILIYLSGNGSEPTSIDNEPKKELLENKKLINRSYAGKFLVWLGTCYKECESNKYRWFLKDFIRYVEITFPKINIEEQ